MNDIEKEQKKIYDDQTKAFMKDRKANAAEKKAPLKEEVTHKVGDTVYATHPVKRYTTMTGKVTRIGKTLTTLTHKDGTTGTYPHSDVNKDYEVLHPNPYKKNESVDEERNVTIGTTAWVKHPTDPKKRLSGKVTSVGKTHISLQHKDGTKEMYLHKDVAVASAKNESVDEGKIVPTHSVSGKPNPNHPAFATYKAKYDADKKAARQPRAKATPTESPVKLHHIDAAISHSYPDVEPYEHLASKFPDLHKAHGKTGSKLMDHLHAVVKKHKAGKDYHDYVDKAHADIKSDAEFDKRNESVDEAYVPGKTVYTSHMDKVLKGKVVEPDEEDKKFTIVNINGKRHSVHNDHIHSRAEHAGFMLEDINESEFKGTPTVKTDKYSWGTMKTIHHGNSFSIPLHPDHQESISKLKDGDTHVFKDETRAKWTATRKGPTVHFAGSVGHTAVPYASLTEDTKPMSFSEYLTEMDSGGDGTGRDAQREKWNYSKEGIADRAKKEAEWEKQHAAMNADRRAKVKAKREIKEGVSDIIKGIKRVVNGKQDPTSAAAYRSNEYIKSLASGDKEAIRKTERNYDRVNKVTHGKMEEGVFDWKANKSEVDWSDKKDKKTEKSAEGGTIHKAREGSRNAETGGKAAKKSVGRPAGEYGGYKIDKAKRDTPEAKAELSRKVMAAKKEGFAIRKDYKGAMTAAIKKRQEELWNEKK